MLVSIAQLQVGQVVQQHGGEFTVVAAPKMSNGHFPLSDHLTRAQGPSNCAVVQTVCTKGEIQGYFKPGKEWTLQGTVGGCHAVSHWVK